MKTSWLSGWLSFCCLFPWLSGGWSWCLVLLSDPPVGSGRLALSSAFVLPGLFLSVFLKEVTTQGTDPRTVLQAGIPNYVRFTWTWDRLLGIYFYLFPIVSSCVSFSALPPRAFDPQAGASGRASKCRARSPWSLLLFTFLSSFLSGGVHKPSTQL